MRRKMPIVLIIIAFALILPFCSEIASNNVSGKLLKDREMDAFMDKYLDQYKMIESSSSPLLWIPGSPEIPYIAVANSPLSKWYIGDHYGRIPRWSKYTRMIDERYETLKKAVPEKTLKTL